ncbi:MAG TPA: hypothetical protein V6D09_20725, partial [Leptolyngbyaceae cyanobacterium]
FTMTSSTVFHHIRRLTIWASRKSNRHSATFNYLRFYFFILSSLGLPMQPSTFSLQPLSFSQ